MTSRVQVDGLQRCFYVHPDNVATVRRSLDVNVAIIVRPDRFLAASGAVQLLVETERGVHTRVFLAEHGSLRFLVVYGRVERQRTTSLGLDYALTQEVVSFLGVARLVGTFVAGSVRADEPASTIYIPHDFVGLGPHDQTRSRGRGVGFRTIDMFEPFCPSVRDALVAQQPAMDFACRTSGIYACFHGWPRVETEAELRRYEQDGYDVVGQTLDPEATLAKEAGTHYAALVATVDDTDLRERLIGGDDRARTELARYVTTCRERMFRLFLAALPALHHLENRPCDCEHQAARRQFRSEAFYYRPAYLCPDWDDSD